MHTPLIHAAPVTFTGHLAEGHLVQGFDVAVATHGLSHVRRRHVAMRPRTIAEVEASCGITLEASIDAMGQLLVLGHADDRELVEVAMQHGVGHVRVAADDAGVADQLVERLVAQLGEPEDDERDPRVSICFWTLGEHGPEPMRRRLHAPRWSQIEDNYGRSISEALGRIMAAPPETARGIALWRGAPGTGKTTALRALAREWRDQVDVHVVIDPEVFLGERASYLVQVLFGPDVDEPWDGDDALEPPLPRGDHAPQRAKLVVLEDAGELISSSARVSSGQALSRLLNLTDGMLGQGANVSMLVTTNEPIERLHPAIARPGRGWSHLEFGAFAPDAANAWLERAGSDARVEAPITLAELYARVRGNEVVTLDDLATT